MPSESNPQFHQQMVYAVAMTTIQNFEKALGQLNRLHLVELPRVVRMRTLLRMLPTAVHAQGLGQYR
jgi:hypothetical protein